jgi:hypothetical protein
MNAEIVLQLSPEEEELAKKREELAILQAELADRELFLADLQAELAAFDGRYLRDVGTLYAELDEWTAKIAELAAKKENTEQSRSTAAEARAEAEESYAAAHGEAAEALPFASSPELKKLYREAAKRVHPDTATDESDRTRRERLMKEVNAAYAVGDEDALRHILTEIETSPDEVKGSGIGADLIRVLRQLKQVKRRLMAIEVEVAVMSETDIAKLKAKVDLAAKQGQDLIAEMAASIQNRINVARMQFKIVFDGGK